MTGASPRTGAELLRRWRGDLVGGVSAALSGLPIELNYGLIALAPLGVGYSSLGVTAAIHGTVLASLVQVLLRGRTLMILGSRPGVMLILASLVSALTLQTEFAPGGAPDVPAILGMVLLCVFLAGVLQASFGLLRLGRLIAFAPQPVLAGLSAGIALSIMIMAVKLALGFPVDASPSRIVAEIGSARFASLLVVAAVAWVMFRPPGRLRTIPTVITGLVVGVVLGMLLELVSSAPVRVAAPAAVLPSLEWSRLAAAFAPDGLGSRLLIVAPYAMTLAILATIESLLTATTADIITGTRQDNDRELVVHGVANAVISTFGAPIMAGNTSRVVACANAGGRGRGAVAVYALFIVAVVMLVPQWIAALPQAIISGMLLVFSWGMIDDWQRRIAAQAWAGQKGLSRTQWREVRTNLVIVLLVACVAVLANLMQAVAVGVAAALFIFVRNNARGVVRSTYTGADRHSLKVRNAADAGFLDADGRRIGIVEAGGSLFFGSAERLATEAEQAANGKDTLIIDLRHVGDVDATGARILQQLGRRLRGQSCRLLLSHVVPGGRVGGALEVFGVASAVPAAYWFADIDSALEAAEDALLATRGGGAFDEQALALARTDLAYGLEAEGLAVLEAHLVPRLFEDGAAVFRQGEPGDSLFVLMRGSVSIRVGGGTGHAGRIAAFGPGVFFGEMALIDRQPRSADAIADGVVEVRELQRSALEALQAKHPAVASRVAMNLSRSLSQRLRVTTQDLRAAAAR